MPLTCSSSILLTFSEDILLLELVKYSLITLIYLLIDSLYSLFQQILPELFLRCRSRLGGIPPRSVNVGSYPQEVPYASMWEVPWAQAQEGTSLWDLWGQGEALTYHVVNWLQMNEILVIGLSIFVIFLLCLWSIQLDFL